MRVLKTAEVQKLNSPYETVVILNGVKNLSLRPQLNLLLARSGYLAEEKTVTTSGKLVT